MPRGKATTGTAGTSATTGQARRRSQPKDEWAGFVQVSVSEARREEFDLWLSSIAEGIWREFNDAVGEGFKFTLSYDGANMCYIASFIGRPDLAGERAFSACLSARGGTFEEAVAVLVYKHVELLHKDWWDAVNEPKRSRMSFG